METILSYCHDIDYVSFYRLRLVSSHFNVGVLSYTSNSQPPYLSVDRLRLFDVKWLGLPFLSKGKMGKVDLRLFGGLSVDFDITGVYTTMVNTLALHGTDVSHLKLLNLKEYHVTPALEAVTEHCPNLRYLKVTLINTGGGITQPPKSKDGDAKRLENMVCFDLSVAKKYKNIATMHDQADREIFRNFIDSLRNLRSIRFGGYFVDKKTFWRLPNTLQKLHVAREIGGNHFPLSISDLVHYPAVKPQSVDTPWYLNIRDFRMDLAEWTDEMFLLLCGEMAALETLHLGFVNVDGTRSFFNALTKHLHHQSTRCVSIKSLRLPYLQTIDPQLYPMPQLQEMFPNLQSIHLEFHFFLSEHGQDVDPSLKETFTKLHLWEKLKGLEVTVVRNVLTLRHLSQLLEAAWEGLFINGFQRLVINGRKFYTRKEAEFELEDGSFEQLSKILLSMRDMKAVTFNDVLFPRDSDLLARLRAFIQAHGLPITIRFFYPC